MPKGIPAPENRCAQIRKNGERCGRAKSPGAEYCYLHRGWASSQQKHAEELIEKARLGMVPNMSAKEQRDLVARYDRAIARRAEHRMRKQSPEAYKAWLEAAEHVAKPVVPVNKPIEQPAEPVAPTPKVLKSGDTGTAEEVAAAAAKINSESDGKTHALVIPDGWPCDSDGWPLDQFGQRYVDPWHMKLFGYVPPEQPDSAEDEFDLPTRKRQQAEEEPQSGLQYGAAPKPPRWPQRFHPEPGPELYPGGPRLAPEARPLTPQEFAAQEAAQGRRGPAGDIVRYPEMPDENEWASLLGLRP